jgi:hypothetical protein
MHLSTDSSRTNDNNDGEDHAEISSQELLGAFTKLNDLLSASVVERLINSLRHQGIDLTHDNEYHSLNEIQQVFDTILGLEAGQRIMRRLERGLSPT